jgi:Flp pilus assembly pilin Flp
MMIFNLWNDQRGGVLTTELVLVASVLTATLLTGLSSFRAHIESEFQQLGQNLHRASGVAVRSHEATVQTAGEQEEELAGTIFAGNLSNFLAD